MKAPASAASTPSSTPASIPECVAHLTALFQLFRETLRYEAAWLAGVPYWDAKQKIGEHLLEDAHHAESLLKRLHELKAANAEHKQVPGVEALLREWGSAANGDEWLRGLYGTIKPWLASQLRTYLEIADPLMDAPTQLCIRRILVELDAQVAWFERFTPQYSPWEYNDTTAWTSFASAVAKPARIGQGQVAGLDQLPPRPANHPDFAGLTQVRRDRTFKVVSTRAEAPEENDTFESRRFMVFYNHLQEMQFAESLGAILFETSEMPWAYHLDIARHISDEVRHARMGQERLEQLGHRIQDLPMMTQHYAFRTNIDPLERFCLMTLVMEGSSFERKRGHVEAFESNNDAVSARYESYDIRDEMLHTNFGHVWVPIMLRVYHDSRSVNELTEHCRGLIAQVLTEYPTNEATMVKK